MTEYRFVTTRLDGDGTCAHNLTCDGVSLNGMYYFALTRKFRSFWFDIRLEHEGLMRLFENTKVETILSGEGLR